ncbi:MAG: DUF2330 domain-containing protein, partial [Thermoplasmata archaeon]|nr:DUF2330 domain-containing protein [Thermoplasmata archaeon]
FYDFTVYEPGQKAIIAWNGTEEIMILSVDVYSTEETKALHMVPFPSMPEMSLGSVDSFEKVEELINSRGHSTGRYGGASLGQDNEGNSSGIEIVFEEQIGPHDMTVAIVNNSDEFTDWVTEFLSTKGIDDVPMPDNMNEVVENYTERDIKYFAFDVVDLEPDTKSVDPIIYRFETDHLFFPLRISSVIDGETKVELALITPRHFPVDYSGMRTAGFYSRISDVLISQDEVNDICEDFPELITGDAHISLYINNFVLSELEEDVWLGKMEMVRWMHSSNMAVGNIEYFDVDGANDIIMADGNSILAIDGETGAPIWRFVPTEEYHQQHYGMKLLYVGEISKGNGTRVVAYSIPDSTLFLLNPLNGEEIAHIKLFFQIDYYSYNYILEDSNEDGNMDALIWSYDGINAIDLSGPDESWHFVVEDHNSITDVSLVKSGNAPRVIIGTYGSEIALDALTGEEVWSIEYGDRVHMEFEDLNDDEKVEMLLQTQIYTGYYTDPPSIYDFTYYLYVLDIENGEILWQYNTSENIYSATIEDLGGGIGNCVVVQNKSGIYVLEGSSGDLLWNVYMPSISSISYYCDDMDGDGKKEIVLTYRESGKYTLKLLNSEEGTEIWAHLFSQRFNTDADDIIIGDINSDGNKEIIVHNSSAVVAIYSLTGTEIWNYSISTEPYRSYLYSVKMISSMENEINGILVQTYQELIFLNGNDGAEMWKVNMGEYTSTVDLVDVDQDGKNEMVVRSSYSLYCIDTPEDCPVFRQQPPSLIIPSNTANKFIPAILATTVIIVIGLVVVAVWIIRKHNSGKRQH